MNTPWGKAQEVTKYDRGLMFVSTAGHGGLMVAKGFAHKHLTPAAIKQAEEYGNYYCYEEDVLYAIPYLELLPVPKYYNQFYSDTVRSFQEIMESLIRTLSLYVPEYLLERGIEPEPEAYAQYQISQKTEELRSAKHPDLITRANRTDDDSITKVITADGKVHYVLASSYIRNPHRLNLLSYCTVLLKGKNK